MAKFQVNVLIKSEGFCYKAGDLMETEAGPLRVFAVEAVGMVDAVKIAQIWADGVNDANGAEVASVVSILTWREKFGDFNADYEI